MKRSIPILTTLALLGSCGDEVPDDAVPVAPRAAEGDFTYVYTLDADFDAGQRFNLSHDAPNNDQLQIVANPQVTPYPFIWVALSGRGTIVRVSTEAGPFGDGGAMVPAGTILGEYRSAPAGLATNPSRTTVDRHGNVWSGNRNQADPGSVIKIGMVVGGTRGDRQPDGSFVANPNGEYLQPPFEYSTAVDRDGDGLIHTSRGLDSVLGWTDVTDGVGGGPAMGDATVQDADDEAILVFQRVHGTSAVRHVSVDPSSNNVWIGSYASNSLFQELESATGALVSNFHPGLLANGQSVGGYGGLVDGSGVLWSGDPAGGFLRTDVGGSVDFGHPSYGTAIDPSGNVWTDFHTGVSSVYKYDPAGNLFAGFPVALGASGATGMCITQGDANVWVAMRFSSQMYRLDPNGNVVAIIPVGANPTGCAVDRLDQVWLTNSANANNHLMRIDPATNTVDLQVDLGTGAAPYNYSDMTGVVLGSTLNPYGTWTFVHETSCDGQPWTSVDWTGIEPAGTSTAVEVRASDSPLAFIGPWTAVTNGAALAGLAGRYLQVRVTMTGNAATGDSPVLEDLTLHTSEDCYEPGSANLVVTELAVANGSCEENPSLTATVTNLGPSSIPDDFEVTFFDGDPAAGGVPVEPGNHTVLVEGGLAPGESREVTLVLSTPSFESIDDLWVEVDSGAVIDESDENDNLYDSGFSVRLPMPIFYALDEIEVGGTNRKPWQVLRYDMRTDQATVLAPVLYADGVAPLELESLAYVPGDDKLYSVASLDLADDGQLVQIDMRTGLATPLPLPVGYHDINGLVALEVDPATREPSPGSGEWTLWAVHYDKTTSPRAHLLEIDRFTGVGTPVVNQARSYEGLALTNDGRLLATVAAGHLFEIDPQTGSSTKLGTLHTDLIAAAKKPEALEMMTDVCGFNFEAASIDPTWGTEGVLMAYSDAVATGTNDQILVVDPATGTSIPLDIALDASSTDIEGLVFVSEDHDPYPAYAACVQAQGGVGPEICGNDIDEDCDGSAVPCA